MSKNKKNKEKASNNSLFESAFAQDLKNQIANKHKIDERKDVNKNELIVKEKVQTKESENNNSNKQVEKISKVDPVLKQEATNAKTVWKRILFGLSLGLSSVIPTLSKSSVNSNFSLYSDFKNKMYGFLKPNGFKNWLLYVLWLLPVFAFAIPMFALAFYGMYKVSESGYGPSLMIGFSGIGLVAAIVYYFTNNVKMPFRRKQFEELTNNNKRPIGYILTFVFAILLILVFVLVARFAWSPGGLSLQPYSSNNPHAPNKTDFQQGFQTSNALLLIAAGFFAGFASLTPGLSSGIMVSMFGMFSKSVFATEIAFNADLNIVIPPNSTEPVDPKSWAWPILIVLLFGYSLGLVANIFTEKWASNKFPEATKVAIFGFMLASPLLSLAAISKYDYSSLSSSGSKIGAAIGLFFILVAVAIVFFYVSHYLGFIKIHEKIKQRQLKEIKVTE